MTSLLFLHGFATNSKVWDAQVKEFSKDFTIHFDTEDLDPEEKLIVIGWSMGGIAAIKYCLQNKDRVKGLVLISAFPKFLKSDDFPLGLSPALMRNLEKKLETSFTNGLKFFYEMIMPDKNSQHLLADITPKDRGQILEDFEQLKTVDIREKLKEINTPTLIIHGNKDQIVPIESAEYLAKHIKNAQMYIFEDVGHAPFIERTKYFNQCLRQFIKKNA